MTIFHEVLTAHFLLGTGTGLLLAFTLQALSKKAARDKQQRTRAAEEDRALQAYEEQPDQIDDDRIDCPLCWEQRNPGQQWFLRNYTPCHEHTSERPRAEEDQHKKEVALQR